MYTQGLKKKFSKVNTAGMENTHECRYSANPDQMMNQTNLANALDDDDLRSQHIFCLYSHIS